MRARPHVFVACPSPPFDATVLRRRLERIVRRGAPVLRLDPGDVRVRVVDAGTMLELGRRHLGKTYATDVLAFPDDARGGDVALCWPVLRAQAEDGPLQEVLRLCVHGLCHLAGYDHDEPRRARAMLRRERTILRREGVPDVARPYDPGVRGRAGAGRLRGE